jgi:hypothetical protein
MKELFVILSEQKFVIFENDNNNVKKMAGKENRFLTKTDAENTIRNMIKNNPTIYKSKS